MTAPLLRPVGRRWLLTRAGGVLGFVVLGTAACGGDDTAGGGPSTRSSAPEPDPTGTPGADGGADGGAGGGAEGGAEGDLEYTRVDLGFVSAFVLVRGLEAAVVDTGVAGSADAIGDALAAAGLGWSGVRHVVLTHKHPDHAGSVADVLARAERATGHVGRADLDAVDAPRPLTALRDGDELFGLQVVGTPGHTPGHVAVFDPATAVLVAGDALTNPGDGLAGPDPQFTEDPAAAAASIRRLARLEPRVVLVGHGAPVVDDAAVALSRLAG